MFERTYSKEEFNDAKQELYKALSFIAQNNLMRKFVEFQKQNSDIDDWVCRYATIRLDNNNTTAK